MPFTTAKINGVSVTAIKQKDAMEYLKKHTVSKKTFINSYVQLVPGWWFSKNQFDNKNELCKLAGMGKIGEWDVAVPQPWLEQPENLKRWKSGEWAVWFYPRQGKNKLFGGPVWSKTGWGGVIKQLTKPAGSLPAKAGR